MSGSDPARNTTDDIVHAVDVTVERRAPTEERLAVIDLAILLHDEDGLSPPSAGVPDPLSPARSTASTQLVARAYPPDAAEYRADAWGSAPGPAGSRLHPFAPPGPRSSPGGRCPAPFPGLP